MKPIIQKWGVTLESYALLKKWPHSFIGLQCTNMFKTTWSVVTYAKTKSETLPPAGLLQPLSIPCQVWDNIIIDFVAGLPISQGKDTIFVVVDRLSKYAHFMSLSHPFTAKVVANKFVEGVVKLYGMPKSIISDCDPIFISKFWQESFTMSGTKLKMSSAYHPQSDGQSKVVNRCLKQYLRSFVHQWPRKWHSFLLWAEFWYNTTFHASIGMTSYQSLYGRPPTSLPEYFDGSTLVHEVEQTLLYRDALLLQLKHHLATATNHMKQTTDKKCRDVSFQEGDIVFLRLQPYRQSSAFKTVHQQLACRFFGPYPILQKVGNMAYKLQCVYISISSFMCHYWRNMWDMQPTHTDLSPISDEGEVVLNLRLSLIIVGWSKMVSFLQKV